MPAGRPKKTTKSEAFEWTDDEDQAELDNDLDIWKDVCERVSKELGVIFDDLESLLVDTYGVEYHWQGILAMPQKHLMRDLRRTIRLRAQGATFDDTGSVPTVVGGYTAEDAVEEGLTVVDDLSEYTDEED